MARRYCAGLPGPIVSLLPARNASADLAAHLESVGHFADAVVALDDGSTDDTRELLEAHPLVHTLLTNPRRDTYEGWDDSANRNRLLAAAQELSPSWVMSLDADELMAADDAAALRAFLDGAPDPDDAYVFPHHRMLGDLEHADGAILWVGRLFAPRTGHAFPDDRLHFVPLPTAIPPERWRRTTFRIQHVGSLTDELRQARLAKYDEVDPHRQWQHSYRHLLDQPRRPVAWPPRGRLLPPLAHQPVPDDDPLGVGELAVSAVVISRNDAPTIDRAVQALVDQELGEPFEVIVVTSGPDRTAEAVRTRHPDVVVLELDGDALPGRARNAGLAVARGRYVTFPGSHIEVAPGALAARLTAHRQGWPMVTDSMRNGTPTAAGWAAYFLDHAAVLPGRPSYVFEAPPPRCSYRRELLVDLGGFAEDVRTAEDTMVNDELFNRGYGAYREQAAEATHHSPCRTPAELVRHHLNRGRGRGRLLADDLATGKATSRQVVRTVVRWVPGRLRWTHLQVAAWGGPLRRPYRRVLPLIALGAGAAWVGGVYELGRRTLLRPRRPRRTSARPTAADR